MVPLHLRHVIGARSAERGLVTHERLPRHFDRVRGGSDRAAVADARRAECGSDLNGNDTIDEMGAMDTLNAMDG